MSNSTNNVSKSSTIVAFEFGDTAVTAFERNGDAWFVAGEVATALGYRDADKAVRTHCKAAENCKAAVLAGLGIPCSSPRGMSIIPERDLYRLVMRSKLPAAEQFEEKVVSEILPAIRKTGGYIVATPEETPEQIMARALQLANDTLARQRAELEAAAPKAAAFDELANTNGLFTLRESAKLCGWPEKLFIRQLVMPPIKWLYVHSSSGRKLAYAAPIKAGYMDVKEVTVFHNTIGRETYGQPMITQKGLTKLAQTLGKFAPEKGGVA